jgi:Tfp pilus assembly protein PilF
MKIEMNKISKILKYKIIKLILIILLSFSINKSTVQAQDYDSKLDIAYNCLNSGKTTEAIEIFEDYLKSYSTNYSIYLQVAYLYKQNGNKDKAKEYFNIVSLNSKIPVEVETANTELEYIKAASEHSQVVNPDEDELSRGYDYINKKDYYNAIIVFEDYKTKHRDDTKIYIQLGYLYSQLNNYRKALDNFQFVEAFSKNQDEIDKSRMAKYYLKDLITESSPRSTSLYFYNVFDSHYSNYISNFTGHLNFKALKNLYTGFYVDAYMDSKSTKGNILNDRYLEGGGFLKYKISENIGFEFRTGYVREIDFDKTGINFKPIFYMGTRIGNPAFYLSRKNPKTDYFYADVFSSELYDYKFRNLFGQLQLKEVMRYMTGGYSFLEFYLSQVGYVDSKQLDYNNYGEFGVGLDFKPNLISFPVLFVEATNKIFFVGPNQQYFQGPFKNTFQIKAGFLINFNTGL